MPLLPINPSTFASNMSTTLSGVVTPASATDPVKATIFNQSLTCEFSSVAVIGDEWPQLVHAYSVGGNTGKLAYRLNLNYSVTQQIEQLHVLSATVAQRIPHELSGASYSSPTGAGTGGIITTTVPGRKLRLYQVGDEEYAFNRFFSDVILIPDPTFGEANLAEQAGIIHWFMYRLLPQLITNGGTSQTLGMGVVSDVGNYGFEAHWSPGGTVLLKEPLPDCPKFRYNLMKY